MSNAEHAAAYPTALAMPTTREGRYAWIPARLEELRAAGVRKGERSRVIDRELARARA